MDRQVKETWAERKKRVNAEYDAAIAEHDERVPESPFWTSEQGVDLWRRWSTTNSPRPA